LVVVTLSLCWLLYSGGTVVAAAGQADEAAPSGSGGFPDYYLALQLVNATTDDVPPPAEVPTPSDADVHRAFKRRALHFHPDKNRSADAASMFRLLAEARATLLHHAYKRQEYDELYERYLAHAERQWMQHKRARAAGKDSDQHSDDAASSALVFVAGFTPPVVDLKAAVKEHSVAGGKERDMAGASQRVEHVQENEVKREEEVQRRAQEEGHDVPSDLAGRGTEAAADAFMSLVPVLKKRDDGE
jgi:hypothetical protein